MVSITKCLLGDDSFRFLIGDILFANMGQSQMFRKYQDFPVISFCTIKYLQLSYIHTFKESFTK